MAETMEVRVKLDDQASRLLKKIDDALRSLDGRMGGLQTSSVAAGTGLGKLASKAGVAKLGIAAVGAAAVATTRAILESARAYENTVNQLRLVTQGTKDYNDTIGRLQTLARDNRTSFDATVELYTKLRVATQDLGMSTQEVEQLTTKMSQALSVAGADAGTASGVIRQFGQAMASGVVRGDEFNSIVEGLGPALNIMAQESGITVGKLREMAGNGELTAEVFSKMLLNSNALTDSFKKLEPTMDQLDQRIGDAHTNLLAAIADYTGLAAATKKAKLAYVEFIEVLGADIRAEANLTPLQKAMEDLAEAKKNLTSGPIMLTGTGRQIAAIEQALAQAQARFDAFGPNGDRKDDWFAPSVEEVTKELELAQQMAENFYKNVLPLSPAYQEAAAKVEQLRLQVDILANAEKQAAIARINAAEKEFAAKAAKEAADKAEAARLKALAAGYKEYAQSRIAGIELEAQKMDRLKELMKEVQPDLAHQEKYASLHKDAMANIALLNRELSYNRELTMGQRRQYRAMVEELTYLKNTYYDAGKAGELYTELVFKNQWALRDNAKERENLIALLDHEKAKLEASGGANETAARAVDILTQALIENGAARDGLLGKMSLETLTARVDATLAEAAANKELAAEFAKTTKDGERLAAMYSILGIATKRTKDEYKQYSDALKDTAGAQKKELGFLQRMKEEYDALKLKVGSFSAEEQKVYDLILKRIKGIEEAGKGPVFDIIDNLKDRLSSLAVSTADTFTDVILGLKNGFEALEDIALNVLRTIISTLIEAQIRKLILGQGITAAGSAGSGLLGGLLGGLGGLGASTLIPGLGALVGIGALIGGFFADGGSTASAGQKPIVVGERGPELFMPGKAGSVVTNEELNAMNGQGDLNVSFTINAIDTQTGVQFLLENKRVITGVIQEAYMRRGSSGPLG